MLGKIVAYSAATNTAPGRLNTVKDAVEAKDWDTLLHLSSQPGGFQEARTVAWYAKLVYPVKMAHSFHV